MIYTKTEKAERIAAIVLIAWAAFFLFLTTTQIQHYDSDIFWALRSGHWIVEHWRVPVTDPFSYTFLGRPWVDFTWSFQVIAHLFYTGLGGWTGLYILQLFLTFITFAVLFFNVRLLTAGRLPLMALLMVLAVSCASPRLIIRPHLFGFLFISIYLLILNIYERRDCRWLIFLILPLQILWINIHSSAILGVFIVWAYAGGEFFDVFARNGLKGFAPLVPAKKRLFILALIVPFVSLINPYGLKLAIFPFIHQGGVNADALHHIGEWSSLPLKEFFLFFYPVPLNYFAFKSLFYLGLLSFFLNRRWLKSRDLMLFAGAAYMGITHLRWAGQFAFFAVPVIAFNLGGFLNNWQCNTRLLRRIGLGFALFIGIMMGIHTAKASFRDTLGIGVSTQAYPMGSVKLMRDMGLKGRLYNSYIFGGYIINNYPGLKVFIDGRTPTVYSPRFFWKSRHTKTNKDWETLSGEFAMTMALVKLDKPLCRVLDKSALWTPVVFDDVSALYLKRDSGQEDIINEYGLSFSPCRGTGKYVLPKKKNEKMLMKKGLQTVMLSIGDGKDGKGFAYPHRLMGLLEGSFHDRADKERGIVEFKKALMIKRDGLTYLDLGLALSKIGRFDEAITAFKTSIRLNKGFKDEYLALGLTYFDKKDYEKAATWLDRYLYITDDNAGFLGLKTLGRAYFNLGKLDKAEDILKKAVFVADNKKARGEAQYYLGNTLFEANRLDEGALYYGRAMDNDRGYKRVLSKLASMFRSRGDKERVSAIESLLKKD